jgi:hypothetical protein
MGKRVQAINTALIPNWKTLDPRVAKGAWFNVGDKALRHQTDHFIGGGGSFHINLAAALFFELTYPVIILYRR